LRWFGERVGAVSVMVAREPDKIPMIDHALDYLRAGLPVFPICSPVMPIHQHKDPDTQKLFTCTDPKTLGKTPLVRWRGYQSQLPEEDDIRFWWRKWPLANIGLATGELSGILVLDADGTDARKEVLRRGGLENTPTVWTGKIGGAHFHLAYPGGDVRNFARKLPGTDMRAQGGYVLMPPSVHATGNEYRWAEGTRHLPRAVVPEWLTELFTASPEAAGEFHGTIDLDEILTGIPEGKRDDTLFRYACKLRHDDVPQAEAEERLRLAARACKPAFPEDAAVGKVRRAYSNPEYDPPGSPTVEVDEFFSPPSGGSPVDESAPAVGFMRPIEELFAKDFPPIDWLVQDLFSAGSNGWIAAEPKVGKSWIALELAYCLATGFPFLSRFAVSRPRRIFYIQEEDSERRVHARLNMLIQGDPSRVRPSGEFFKHAVRQGFKLDRDGCLSVLRAEIEIHSPEVIILDVFNRLHGSDENKQQDMTAILNELNSITNTYGCSFIIVHHNRKPQAGNEARGNQMIRGSGVLAGWGECSLYLRKGKNDETIYVLPESKDSSPIDEFSVTLVNDGDGGVVLEVGDETAKTERLTMGDKAVLEAVDSLVARGIGASAKNVADAVGRDRSTTQTRLTRLVDAGYLIATPISDAYNATKIYTRAEAG